MKSRRNVTRRIQKRGASQRRGASQKHKRRQLNQKKTKRVRFTRKMKGGRLEECNEMKTNMIEAIKEYKTDDPINNTKTYLNVIDKQDLYNKCLRRHTNKNIDKVNEQKKINEAAAARKQHVKEIREQRILMQQMQMEEDINEARRMANEEMNINKVHSYVDPDIFNQNENLYANPYDNAGSSESHHYAELNDPYAVPNYIRSGSSSGEYQDPFNFNKSKTHYARLGSNSNRKKKAKYFDSTGTNNTDPYGYAILGKVSPVNLMKLTNSNK